MKNNLASQPQALTRLVIASHNDGKLAEIAALLEGFPFAVCSAGALGLAEPEETGESFAENAALKARAAAEAAGMPALGDDSGLAIPALDGAPGIYSARWAGQSKNFTAAFARIQQELHARAVGPVSVPAYFICALCLARPGGATHHFEGRVDGHLVFPPRGSRGFGYDPIFIPQGETQTFAEMPAARKQALSHRGQALAKLIAFLHESVSDE